MNVPSYPYTRAMIACAGFLFVALAASGCTRAYPDCETDDHCTSFLAGDPSLPDTPYCVDRRCQECAQNAHCDDGEECSAGACQPIDNWCRDDAQCPSPMVCRDNACALECTDNFHCTEGPFPHCENNRCATGECLADSDCRAGFRCDDHACVEGIFETACETGQFEPIYFDFDEATLGVEARATIADWNYQCVQRHPDRPFRVEGHCDERGTTEYNLALGDRRARNVRDFFADMGVERERMRTISFGESRPANPRSTHVAWAENRRAEMVWE